MSDVKWIKIVTDIFSNRKIQIIESMPEGDSIIVIWFKILTLAGKTNDNGSVYFTQDIPFTDQMLATAFNRPLTTVQLALTTFEKFGMIEIVDDFIHVSNWEKYQNVDGLDRMRENTRKRVAKHRERKKLELSQKLDENDQIGHDVTLHDVTDRYHVTQCNATEEEREEEKEEEQKKESGKRKSSRLSPTQMLDNLLPDRQISEPLVEKLHEWFKYKDEIKKPLKSETGVKSFLTQMEKAEQKYGTFAVMNQIDKSMARGYQGIFFDDLERKNGSGGNGGGQKSGGSIRDAFAAIADRFDDE